MRVFSLAEPELARLISEIESEPLFQRIRPFIRRLPFNARGLHLPLDENAASSGHDPIPWSEHEDELELIRRIGRERFERFFLLNETEERPEEVALSCGLASAEVLKIRQFLLTLSLQSHALGPSVSLPSPGQNVTCIARVVLSGGKPEISWLLPQLARGRYGIDYEGLSGFQNSGLSAEEKERLKEFLSTLELINLRHDTLCRALQTALERQPEFLQTGQRWDLRPFTAAELSRELKVHASTVGRIARRRSLLMPWGEELPLSSLLPNRRAIAVSVVALILSRKRKLTDEALRKLLHDKFGITLSRRTINECRLEAAARET